MCEAKDPIPLVALLGQAERAFAEEFDARIRATEFCALSLAHARNVLRHLTEGPTRASQIVGGCDVTKQAVSQQIAHLQRNGYVEVGPDPDDQRARLVTLTPRGVQAQAVVMRLFAEIETEWAQRHGAQDIGTLRRILTETLRVTPETARSTPEGCAPPKS